MTPKTIIALGIVGVLVLGGVAYWWLSPSSGAPATSNGTTNTGTTGFNQSSVTADSNGTPSDTNQPQTGATPKNYDAQYADFLQKSLAQKVAFSRVQSDAGAEGSAYTFFAADVADSKKSYPTATDFSIGVALVDVTDDGVPEALVYEDLLGYCGTAGCPFYILQKKGTTWTLLFAAQVQDDVALTNVITSGHTDLLLSVQGPIGYQTDIKRYSWNGTRYATKALAARWDGSAFVVYQQ